MRCISVSGRLSWKVFPEMTCFEGSHVSLAAMALVAAGCQLLVGWLSGATLYECRNGSSNVFARYQKTLMRMNRQNCVTDLSRVLMWGANSALFLIVDDGLHVTFAAFFVAFAAANVYVFQTADVYYSQITQRVLCLMCIVCCCRY